MSVARLILLQLLALLVCATPCVVAQDEDDDDIDWSQFEAIGDDDDDDDDEEEDDFDDDDFDEEDSEPFGAGFVELLDELIEDPTLDGKIRFFYSATYRGRFHEFGDFDYPFPDTVTPDDIVWARELRRRRDDWDDHDFDQYFSLGWTEFLTPDEDSWWQTVDLEASGRYFKDLDGSPSGEATLGTYDALSGNDALQLHSLNARAEFFERHLEVRAGRQHAREAEWIHFDGAHARFRGLTIFGKEVELSAFGGSRVRFFRRASSEHVGIGGAAVRVWPWEGGRIRLSDVYFHDNSLELEFLQRHSLGYTSLTYRQINEDPQSVWLDNHFDIASTGMKIDVRYRGKLGSGADDYDYDYTRSRRRNATGTAYLWFGDLAPYDEITVELHQSFLEYWGVFLGGTVHQLRDRDSRDEWNTDWQEAWGGIDVNHAPWKGFTGRATVRYMHTDLRRRLLRNDVATVLANATPDFQPQDITGDGEPDFLGLELLFEQDFARVVSAGVIVVFRGYDYQSNFAVLEDFTATSTSVYARWRATKRTSWSLTYSYDRDFEKIYPDLEAVHSVRIQFTYRLR